MPMQIFNVFDKYFLMMMIILGLVTVIKDSSRIEKSGNHKRSRFIKALGLVMIVASFALYILHNIYA